MPTNESHWPTLDLFTQWSRNESKWISNRPPKFWPQILPYSSPSNFALQVFALMMPQFLPKKFPENHWLPQPQILPNNLCPPKILSTIFAFYPNIFPAIATKVFCLSQLQRLCPTSFLHQIPSKFAPTKNLCPFYPQKYATPNLEN